MFIHSMRVADLSVCEVSATRTSVHTFLVPGGTRFLEEVTARPKATPGSCTQAGHSSLSASASEGSMMIACASSRFWVAHHDRLPRAHTCESLARPRRPWGRLTNPRRYGHRGFTASSEVFSSLSRLAHAHTTQRLWCTRMAAGGRSPSKSSSWVW